MFHFFTMNRLDWIIFSHFRNVVGGKSVGRQCVAPVASPDVAAPPTPTAPAAQRRHYAASAAPPPAAQFKCQFPAPPIPGEQSFILKRYNNMINVVSRDKHHGLLHGRL